MKQDDFVVLKSTSYVPYPMAMTFMQDYVDRLAREEVKPALWFLEHPPLYTAGMSAKPQDFLEGTAPLYKTNRGGQITYHGPGQQIVYVMMPLDFVKRDVRAYVCFLEDWLISVLSALGLEAFRLPGKIGIWVEGKDGPKKIAALGVRVKKWIAYHGIALNHTVDLKAFQSIVPCGIRELGVTSLDACGVKVGQDQLQDSLVVGFNKKLSNI